MEREGKNLQGKVEFTSSSSSTQYPYYDFVSRTKSFQKPNLLNIFIEFEGKVTPITIPSTCSTKNITNFLPPHFFDKSHLNNENNFYFYNKRTKNYLSDKQQTTTPFTIKITKEKANSFSIDKEFLINENTPLIHYGNQLLLSLGQTTCNNGVNVIGEKLVAFENFSLSLNRTIRVENDGKEHKLPTNLGLFPVFLASDFASSLPASWTSLLVIFLFYFNFTSFF